MNSKFLSFLFFLVILANPSHACPAFLYGDSLSWETLPKRSDLRIFTLAKENNTRIWQEVPLQIDPMLEDQILDAKNLNTAMQSQLTKFDRLTLRLEDFKEKKLTSDSLPCDAKRAYELKDPSRQNAFAYLVACTSPSTIHTRKVEHLVKERKITTDRYQYEYLSSNQLMFKTFDIKDGKTFSTAAHDASIFLRFDVKSFFTLNFRNKNIRSLSNAVYTGSLGTVGSYSFFLKILFFNIDLSLDTTASFYEDAALIPMVFKVPKDNAVYRGSGTFYWWQNGPDLKWDLTKSTVPAIDPEIDLNDPEKLVEIGLKNCKEALCTYSLEGSLKTQSFGVDLNVPIELVKFGFFPQLVVDIADFEKRMKWPASSIEESPSSIGVYFEVASVPEGVYRVEQWLRMGHHAQSACPRPVSSRPISK